MIKENWEQMKIIKQIIKYLNNHFEESKPRKKVFYHLEELGGWRFWLKAIRYLDFRSMGTQMSWYFKKIKAKKTD